MEREAVYVETQHQSTSKTHAAIPTPSPVPTTRTTTIRDRHQAGLPLLASLPLATPKPSFPSALLAAVSFFSSGKSNASVLAPPPKALQLLHQLPAPLAPLSSVPLAHVSAPTHGWTL